MDKDGDQHSDEAEDEPLPKLPRAPLFRKLSLPALVRIGMFITLLYAVVAMRRPCAEGVGRFVGGFGADPDAGPMTPAERYPGYEFLTAEEALKRWPDAPDGGTSDASRPDASRPDAADASDQRSKD